MKNIISIIIMILLINDNVYACGRHDANNHCSHDANNNNVNWRKPIRRPISVPARNNNNIFPNNLRRGPILIWQPFNVYIRNNNNFVCRKPFCGRKPIGNPFGIYKKPISAYWKTFSMFIRNNNKNNYRSNINNPINSYNIFNIYNCNLFLNYKWEIKIW